MKEYRLSEEDASKLDANEIICKVVGRIADDTPSFSDADAMDAFFSSILPVQAAVFSALYGGSFAVVGGMWHIFECCSAPMVYKAIEGFELFHAPGPADTLRRACACFPDGVVPRSSVEVEDFIFGDEDAIPRAAELGAEFESRRFRKDVEPIMNFESVYRDYRDCFVISSPVTA